MLEELETENRMLRARNDRLEREADELARSRLAREPMVPTIPAPAKGEAHGIEAKVCADIAARQLLGMNKYGVSVQDNPLPLRQWLEHAYQECLDQAIYLRRAMQDMDKSQGAA